MSEIIETDSPDPADIAVIADGLRVYNTAMAGYDDYRPLAVFVTDPATDNVIGGLYGASSRGQLRVDRFFLPQELRRDRIGSRLLKMAEEEGRRRPLHAGDLKHNGNPSSRLLPETGLRDGGETRLRFARSHPLCDDKTTPS